MLKNETITFDDLMVTLELDQVTRESLVVTPHGGWNMWSFRETTVISTLAQFL